MRILVTGANGFLGAYVCRAGANAGLEVLAGMRPTADAWRVDALAPKATRVTLSLPEQESSLDRLLMELRPDVIVNCAAYGVDYRQQDVATAINVNVRGAVDLVSAAAANNVSRFIHIGTSYEYGPSDIPMTEEQPLQPRAIYGSSKAAGSLIVQEQARTLGLPTVILRLFTMFGALEGSHKILPTIARHCLVGEPLSLSPGGQKRDFVHVETVATTIIQFIQIIPFPANEVFNIGGGKLRSLRVMGQCLVELSGASSDLLRWGDRAYRQNEIPVVSADTSKIKSVCGWCPNDDVYQGLSEILMFERQRLRTSTG